MADVLEHMPFPDKALQHVYKLLEVGGVLFISMPNMVSQLWRTMDQQNINPYWGEIEHYHNFGRGRLFSLLEDCGFQDCRYGVSKRYRACMEITALRRR
jgi:predicted SAM-dependent methyltransferase